MNLTTKDLETILYSLKGYMQANDDTVTMYNGIKDMVTVAILDDELVEELEDICYRIDKKLQEKYKESEEINELKSLLKEVN